MESGRESGRFPTAFPVKKFGLFNQSGCFHNLSLGCILVSQKLVKIGAVLPPDTKSVLIHEFQKFGILDYLGQ